MEKTKRLISRLKYKVLALSIVALLLATIWGWCFHRERFGKPDFVSIAVDKHWRHQTETKIERITALEEQIQTAIQTTLKSTPGAPDLFSTDEGVISTRHTYGRLPTLFVDENVNTIFPLPLPEPVEFSWYRLHKKVHQELIFARNFEKALNEWARLSDDDRLKAYSQIEAHWNRFHVIYAEIAQEYRYLKSWITNLIAYQENPAYLNSAAPLTPLLHEGKIQDWKEARARFRPKRVMKRSFLPDRVSGTGAITLRVFTDVSDKNFLEEMDWAIELHWNRSPWAKSNNVQFKIAWIKRPINSAFAQNKISLDEHLATFPEDQAAITTGGLTTFVRRNVLVLGPGKITPRTLAHEFGHILGFEDCYYRTLHGRGAYGLTLLEWANPIYPDDLMCDNIAGVAQAMEW